VYRLWLCTAVTGCRILGATLVRYQRFTVIHYGSPLLLYKAIAYTPDLVPSLHTTHHTLGKAYNSKDGLPYPRGHSGAISTVHCHSLACRSVSYSMTYMLYKAIAYTPDLVPSLHTTHHTLGKAYNSKERANNRIQCSRRRDKSLTSTGRIHVSSFYAVKLAIECSLLYKAIAYTPDLVPSLHTTHHTLGKAYNSKERAKLTGYSAAEGAINHLPQREEFTFQASMR
jgi:hypothetical protein